MSKGGKKGEIEYQEVEKRWKISGQFYLKVKVEKGCNTSNERVEKVGIEYQRVEQKVQSNIKGWKKGGK